jgi:hypothetical protein
MKRKLQLLGILSLIALIFTVALKMTFDGYYGFYYEEGNYKKPLLYEATEKITAFTPVSFFLAHTGFDTGYGFFAPNVASDFILMFDIKNAQGDAIEKTVMPQFKQKESRVRYTSMFNMFLDKLEQKSEDKDTPYAQYLDIVLRQITTKVKSDYPMAVSIHSKLYLYDYPTLERYKKGETQEKVILISELKL